MNTITLILTLLMLFTVNECTRVCSSIDTMTIDLSLPDEVRKAPEKMVSRITKIKYDPSTPIRAQRAEWKSIYCPAVEFGLIEDCKEKRGSPTISDTYSRQMLDQDRGFHLPYTCPAGKCDGFSEHECLTPSGYRLVTGPLTEAGQLTSSWIHHRCVREVKIEVIETQAYTKFRDALRVELEIPDIGSCTLNDTLGSCIINDEWHIKVRKTLLSTISSEDFPCLSKDAETICYDSTEGFQFSVSPGECKHYVGVTYCQGKPGVGKDNDGTVRIVTPETIEELGLQVEYDNLANTYDSIVLNERITLALRLVKSLILFGFKLTDDPLSGYLGMGIEAHEGGVNFIKGNVCAQKPLSKAVLSPVVEKGTRINLLNHSSRILDFHHLRTMIPFLKLPPHSKSHLLNKTRILHGDSPIVEEGILNFEFFGNMVQRFIHMLMTFWPCVNTLLIVAILLRIRG